MQLYVIHPDPSACPRALDDVRLRAAVKESGQILSTALRKRGFQIEGLYKEAYPNHPCTAWATRTLGNLEWTRRYFIACGREYVHRFSKRHKSTQTLDNIYGLLIPGGADSMPRRPEHFCNAAANKERGFDFTHLPTFEAYKAYLNARWAADDKQPTWTKRNAPEWAEVSWDG